MCSWASEVVGRHRMDDERHVRCANPHPLGMFSLLKPEISKNLGALCSQQFKMHLHEISLLNENPYRFFPQSHPTSPHRPSISSLFGQRDHAYSGPCGQKKVPCVYCATASTLKYMSAYAVPRYTAQESAFHVERTECRSDTWMRRRHRH